MGMTHKLVGNSSISFSLSHLTLQASPISVSVREDKREAYWRAVKTVYRLEQFLFTDETYEVRFFRVDAHTFLLA